MSWTALVVEPAGAIHLPVDIDLDGMDVRVAQALDGRRVGLIVTSAGIAKTRAPGRWQTLAVAPDGRLTSSPVAVAVDDLVTTTNDAWEPAALMGRRGWMVLTVPLHELADGTFISETAAICDYLEALHPEPPLLGRDPRERAIVAMWDRRCELDGFYAVAEALRNKAKGMKGRALTGLHQVDQIPELVHRGRARVHHFFEALDAQLGKGEFLTGDSFTLADITALVTVDFASWVKLNIPDELHNAKRWHEAVSARPSAKA